MPASIAFRQTVYLTTILIHISYDYSDVADDSSTNLTKATSENDNNTVSDGDANETIDDVELTQNKQMQVLTVALSIALSNRSMLEGSRNSMTEQHEKLVTTENISFFRIAYFL